MTLYYLQAWATAAGAAEASVLDPMDEGLAQLGRLVLAQIGVTGVPVPSGTPFGQLDRMPLSAPWASGAVAPATFAKLIGLLLVGLSADQCGRVGDLLVAYARPGGDDPETERYAVLQQLQELRRTDPGLNSYPHAPVLSVNTFAPRRAIREAVTTLIQDFKRERGVPETRRRDDDLPDYLAVWDRREGGPVTGTIVIGSRPWP